MCALEQTGDTPYQTKAIIPSHILSNMPYHTLSQHHTLSPYQYSISILSPACVLWKKQVTYLIKQRLSYCHTLSCSFILYHILSYPLPLSMHLIMQSLPYPIRAITCGNLLIHHISTPYQYSTSAPSLLSPSPSAPSTSLTLITLTLVLTL